MLLRSREARRPAAEGPDVRWLERAQPLALLVLRIALGLVMFIHGYAKVFGGMAHHVALVRSLGLPGWLAYPSAGIELIGGLLILFGAATRISALLVLIDLVVAILKVDVHQGLRGGYEFPLSLAAIAFALIFFGAGPISVDWLSGGGGRK